MQAVPFFFDPYLTNHEDRMTRINFFFFTGDGHFLEYSNYTDEKKKKKFLNRSDEFRAAPKMDEHLLKIDQI